MVKFRKAFIAVVFSVAAVITVMGTTSDKGFSSVQKQGYLTEDVMIQSKGGHDLYYACRGDDISVKTFEDGTCYVSVNNKTGYIPSDDCVSYEVPDFPDLCKGDGANKGIIDTVNKQLLLIPEKYRDLFQSSGWTMVATNEDLNEKFYDGVFNSVYGSTSYDTHIVYIQNNMNAAEDASLHEFGHWLDWYANYPSQNDVFKEIYDSENQDFYKEFDLSMHWDEKEFFAEGFDRFYTDRLKMETVAPKLYSYMADILHNLS